MPKPACRPARPQIDVQHLAELERIERRIENALRDLRLYRAGQIRSLSDRGVLGARDLTAFILELLKMSARHGAPKPGLTVKQLLSAAEGAGYAIPTARTLSKRLTTRAYRTGDIEWVVGSGTWTDDSATGYWHYKGDPQA